MKVKVKSLSRVRLLATPWTTAYQAPPSMGFSGQEYWIGVSLPSTYYVLNVSYGLFWRFLYNSSNDSEHYFIDQVFILVVL